MLSIECSATAAGRTNRTWCSSCWTMMGSGGSNLSDSLVPLRLGLLVVAMCVAGPAWAGSATATYHGTVVDAETGTPLQGASVTVVWVKRPVIAMDGPEYFHEARE